MKDLEALKKELNGIAGKRDVELWNELRELAKSEYPKEVIYELDGSGFIHQWLRSEFPMST